MNNIYVVSCQRNANKFALNCLESVRVQTIEAKKHFFIDDKSSDNTKEYAEHFLEKYPNSNV